MKHILSLILFSFFSCLSNAQTLENQDIAILEFAEVMPQFAGGEKALFKFISKHLVYPKEALKKKIEGTVYIKCVVHEKGTISNVTALNDLGYGMAEEAIRIVENLPLWRPGEHNNKKVNVYTTIPVRFEIVKNSIRFRAR